MLCFMYGYLVSSGWDVQAVEVCGTACMVCEVAIGAGQARMRSSSPRLRTAPAAVQ